MPTFAQLATACVGSAQRCSHRSTGVTLLHDTPVRIHRGSANDTSQQYADIPSTCIASILEVHVDWHWTDGQNTPQLTSSYLQLYMMLLVGHYKGSVYKNLYISTTLTATLHRTVTTV